MIEFNLKQFDPQHNYAIEASAGSGKTYSVVEIVIKLLEAGLSLDQILIVTYTEKAAGELKNRIRERIVEANLKDVDLDSSEIYTIHSFCKKVIDEYYYLINASSKLDVVNDQALELFIDSYIRDEPEVREALSKIFYVEAGRTKKCLVEAIKLYYLKKNGQEDSKIISLNTEEDETMHLSQRATAAFLADAYQKWQIEKAKKNIQTFNDMLRTVREALVTKNNSLIDVLKEKYLFGIIDEFQDTNQLQWDIFSNLFLSDSNHHIVVVGDPKQSIYAFQGADVNVYQQAVSEIESKGGYKQNLPFNWRSSKEMIEACNNFFSTEFFLDPNIAFNASKSPANNNKIATFDDQPLKPFWISPEIEPYDYSEVVVKYIIDCTTVIDGKTRLQIFDKTKLRNVTFNDFVVLGKTKGELEYLKNALRNYGIPYLKYKDDELFKSTECGQWITLLKAITTPDLTGKNSDLFKQVLFTRFFDLSLFELNDSQLLQKTAKEIELINSWKRLADAHLYEDLFDDIIIESDMISRMADSTELDSFSRFRQIANYAISYLMEKHTILELIDFLTLKNKDIEDEEVDEEDANIVARSTNFDAVRLMTIHASKGLEFPVVISAAGFKGRFYNYSSFIKQDEAGHKKLYFKTDICDNYDDVDEECMRLFYVDLTRARYLLFLPIYADVKDYNYLLREAIISFSEKEENKQYIQELIDHGTKKEYIDKAKQVLNYLSSSKKASNVTEESDEKGFKRLRAVSDEIDKHKTYKHSYSSLTHAHEEVIIDDELNTDKENSTDDLSTGFDLNAKWSNNLKYDLETKPIVIDEAFPKGAIIGTALHEVMEKWDFASSEDERLKQLIKQVLDYYGYHKSEWQGDTFNLVKAVLAAHLPIIHGSIFIDDYFTLSSISNDDKLSEVEFNFNKENEFLKNYFTGFIDLIIRRGEYYSVLDWKSDSLNDEEFDSYAKAESLKEHVDNRYAIQRVLYSYVLIKWLQAQYKDKTEEQIFQEHFGGVYYVFLKGCNAGLSNGVYAQTWETYEDLSKEYQRIIKMIGGNK